MGTAFNIIWCMIMRAQVDWITPCAWPGSFQKAVYFCNMGIMLWPVVVRKATWSLISRTGTDTGSICPPVQQESTTPTRVRPGTFLRQRIMLSFVAIWKRKKKGKKMLYKNKCPLNSHNRYIIYIIIFLCLLYFILCRAFHCKREKQIYKYSISKCA